MKKCIGIVLIAGILFFCGIFPQAASSGGCEECAALEAAGFPAGYREALCAVQKKHPEWRFVPLSVTALSDVRGENYSFGYVLDQELRTPSRNLVPSGEVYRPYRAEGGECCDSGYFPASREAVAYFVDPRPHLSEKGIFQFLDLSNCADVSVRDVERALENTDYSRKETAEAILSLGKKHGINPLGIAVRLRREQGREGNCLLWGKSGTVLWNWYQNGTQTEAGRQILAPAEGHSEKELLSLDGFFNPLNVAASGTGAFRIYEAGARYAAARGWDSFDKGLEGGIRKIAEEYVLRFQNTPYLQKWNVDIRSCGESGASRNFWGQYMQNVGGAKREGEMLYDCYLQTGLLSCPLVFCIPVYDAMPPFPSPDPAEGKCPLFSAEERTLCQRGSLVTEDHEENMSEKSVDAAQAPERQIGAKENPAQREREKRSVPLVLALGGLFLLAKGFLLCKKPRFLEKKRKILQKKVEKNQKKSPKILIFVL